MPVDAGTGRSCLHMTYRMSNWRIGKGPRKDFHVKSERDAEEEERVNSISANRVEWIED